MIARLTLLIAIAALTISSVAAQGFPNRVFLIRHGEKPSNDSTPGLSSTGEERAQCLPNVFGTAEGYDIGYILTQDFKSDGSRDRPYETVTPLASSLELTIDHHCDRDDAQCASDAVSNFAATSSQDILICWEHDALSDISADLGAGFDYPSSNFNLIYEIQNGQLTDNSPFSENCPGLDN